MLSVAEIKLANWRHCDQKYILLVENQHSIFTFHHLHASFPGEGVQTQILHLCDRCQIFERSIYQNILALTWFYTASISLDFEMKWYKITIKYEQRFHSLGTWINNLAIGKDFFHFICQFHQVYGINASVFTLLHLSRCKGCWGISDLLVSSIILITMEGMVAVLEFRDPTHREVDNWKIFAAQQVCQLHLAYSLRPGSWQTYFGLGTMPRYSVQFLICRSQGMRILPTLCCDFNTDLKLVIFKLMSRISILKFPLKLPSGECHEHLFRFGAVRDQAMIWLNVENICVAI